MLEEEEGQQTSCLVAKWSRGAINFLLQTSEVEIYALLIAKQAVEFPQVLAS